MTIMMTMTIKEISNINNDTNNNDTNNNTNS